MLPYIKSNEVGAIYARKRQGAPVIGRFLAYLIRERALG
jgi:hypothetical protein